MSVALHFLFMHHGPHEYIQTPDFVLRSVTCRYPDLNSFIRGNWEARFLDSWDANDMITLINTWQQGDVSLVRHGGDLEKCLSEITAKGLIMPSKTDLYFPVSVQFVKTSLMGSQWYTEKRGTDFEAYADLDIA